MNSSSKCLPKGTKNMCDWNNQNNNLTNKVCVLCYMCKLKISLCHHPSKGLWSILRESHLSWICGVTFADTRDVCGCTYHTVHCSVL